MEAFADLSEPAADLPPPPVDEAAWLSVPAEEAARIAAELPLSARFRLRGAITPVQQAFLDRHGYVVYDRVASVGEIDQIASEVERIEADLLARDVKKVHGIPVWVGRGVGGKPWIQRMGFTSVFSDYIRAFVRDPRFDPIRGLIGEGARVGDEEKDGVVVNRYGNLPGSLRPRLGWHTDALRDVVYNWRPPGPMLNVGLHFDRIRPEDGGLRVLPGTHTQGVWSTLFSKIHFVTQAPDPREVAVETWPGDLTVHDGRMWHRVEASPHEGARSIRTSMYVPYVVDAYQPKSERSATPVYLRVFSAVLAVRKWLSARALSR